MIHYASCTQGQAAAEKVVLQGWPMEVLLDLGEYNIFMGNVPGPASGRQSVLASVLVRFNARQESKVAVA
jgi:hypothetical protein